MSFNSNVIISKEYIYWINIINGFTIGHFCTAVWSLYTKVIDSHSFQATGGGSAVDANGTFVTGSEVSCSIPNITTERPAITRQDISVANDGILYSNVLEFLTFDSVCMACGKDKVCTQKVNIFALIFLAWRLEHFKHNLSIVEYWNHWVFNYSPIAAMFYYYFLLVMSCKPYS